jgi:hypothetical protein
MNALRLIGYFDTKKVRYGERFPMSCSPSQSPIAPGARSPYGELLARTVVRCAP